MDRRDGLRFLPLEFRDWSLKLNGKDMPAKWLGDLSREGLRISMGHYKCLQPGDSVEVRLEVLNHLVFEKKATVQWVKDQPGGLNLKEVGLNFISDLEEQKAFWPARYIKIEESVSEVKPHSSYEEWPQLLLWSALVPFLAGLAAQLFLLS